MHNGLLWVGLNDSSFVASSFSNCGFLMENRVPEATSIIATTLHRCQSAHRWLLLVKQVGGYHSVLGNREKINGTFREFIVPRQW